MESATESLCGCALLPTLTCAIGAGRTITVGGGGRIFTIFESCLNVFWNRLLLQSACMSTWIYKYIYIHTVIHCFTNWKTYNMTQNYRVWTSILVIMVPFKHYAVYLGYRSSIFAFTGLDSSGIWKQVLRFFEKRRSKFSG